MADFCQVNFEMHSNMYTFQYTYPAQSLQLLSYLLPEYQMKERFYLVATSIVAAFVFILIFVILIIKCKSKHNKHQSCDHPSEVSMLSTESRSVEVTGEQETGYVEGIMKETPRKGSSFVQNLDLYFDI